MVGGRGANASTVTGAFVRKLQASFAYNGSDYGGGGVCSGGGDGDRRRGSGSRESFVLGGDRIADRGAVSQCMDLPPRADIPRARPRRYRWER